MIRSYKFLQKTQEISISPRQKYDVVLRLPAIYVTPVMWPERYFFKRWTKMADDIAVTHEITCKELRNKNVWWYISLISLVGLKNTLQLGNKIFCWHCPLHKKQNIARQKELCLRFVFWFVFPPYFTLIVWTRKAMGQFQLGLARRSN